MGANPTEEAGIRVERMERMKRMKSQGSVGHWSMLMHFKGTLTQSYGIIINHTLIPN